MKRYVYEIELETPLEFIDIYSDEELSGKEIEKKVIERVLGQIEIYNAYKKDRKNKTREEITEEIYNDLAPGI